MTKKVKFPLEMAENVQVRNLDELREHFDLERVIRYFLDGKLLTWLEDRYYEEESEAVAALSKEDARLGKRLSEIFGIAYESEEEADVEAISLRNERLAKLRQFTDDDAVLKNVDSVAFDQEELAALYDEGVEKIYLCEGSFVIPMSKRELEYVVLGGAKVEGLASAEPSEKPEKDKAEAPEGGAEAEYELRLRYLFDPKIEKTHTNDDGEVYNRKILSLFRKNAAGYAEKMISDEDEDVESFVVTPDHGIIYSVIEQDTFYILQIFELTRDGEKRRIARHETCGREPEVQYIYMDTERVVYKFKGDSFYATFYFAMRAVEDSNKLIIENCVISRYASSLASHGQTSVCEILKFLTVLHNHFWFLSREKKLCCTDLDVSEKINTTIVQNDTVKVRVNDNILYTLAEKEHEKKFYKVNAETEKVEYIADCYANTNFIKEMTVYKNKIIYLSELYGREPVLCVLDVNTRKTITVDQNILPYNGGGFDRIEIIVKDDVIYYADEGLTNNKCLFRRRVNLDGTGKMDLKEQDFEFFKKKDPMELARDSGLISRIELYMSRRNKNGTTTTD